MSARASRSSPSSGSSRNRPTRTGPGPQTATSYQGSARPTGRAKTSYATDSSKCSIPSVTASATVCMSETVRGMAFRTLVGRLTAAGRLVPVIVERRERWVGSDGGGVRRLRTHRAVRGGRAARARVRPAARPAATRTSWELAASHPGLDVRPASVDDPASLDRALAGADAVINCAGPVRRDRRPRDRGRAARRDPVRGRRRRDRGQRRHVRPLHRPRPRRRRPVVPAMAFYGGLGDLLVTAAMGDWTAADEAHIAYGLNSWHPTPGTRAGRSPANGGRPTRPLHQRPAGVPRRTPCRPWSGPSPTRWAPAASSASSPWPTSSPSPATWPSPRSHLHDRRGGHGPGAADTPAPVAVDERGRSAQTFLVDVVVRSGDRERRAVASGQDIYAVTAPLVVEAVHRILTGQTRTPASPPPARSSTRPTSCARCRHHLRRSGPVAGQGVLLSRRAGTPRAATGVLVVESGSRHAWRRRPEPGYRSRVPCPVPRALSRRAHGRGRRAAPGVFQ